MNACIIVPRLNALEFRLPTCELHLLSLHPIPPSDSYFDPAMSLCTLGNPYTEFLVPLQSIRLTMFEEKLKLSLVRQSRHQLDSEKRLL